MTREEELDWLYRLKSKIYVYMPKEWIIPMNNALDMVIKELEQEPCDDAISRQAVLSKKIYTETEEGWSGYTVDADYIEHLPSVRPQEPKTGHWIAQNIHNCHTDFKCSECGYIHNFTHLYGEPTADYTYCPNCGTRMIKSKEGSDKE